MAWQKRKKTAERYGVCTRTVERWEENDPTFPKSMIRNGRKYDNEEALDAWDSVCAARDRSTRTPPNAGRKAVGAEEPSNPWTSLRQTRQQYWLRARPASSNPLLIRATRRLSSQPVLFNNEPQTPGRVVSTSWYGPTWISAGRRPRPIPVLHIRTTLLCGVTPPRRALRTAARSLTPLAHRRDTR
jgi:hypothetical protein